MPTNGSCETQIFFEKYQSLENDFIIIDRNIPEFFPVQIAQKLCNRKQGIGADGIIHVIKTKSKDRYKMLIQNGDGSDGQFSGNGLRCLAAYLFKKYALNQIYIELEQTANSIRCCKSDDTVILTTMPIPKILHLRSPMIYVNDEKVYTAYIIHIPNPHCLLFNLPTFKEQLCNENILAQEVAVIKKQVPNHNVSWIITENSHATIHMRTYERGVGFTQACTSAAIALITLLHQQKILTSSEKTIHMPGGTLVTQYDSSTNELHIIANAYFVFSGTFYI